MAWILSAVLAVVICGGIVLYGVAGDDKPQPVVVVAGMILLVMWLVLGTAWASFHSIGSGQLGVVSGLSGVIDGQVGPGTHWLAPWDGVQTVSTKVQTANFPHLTAFSHESQDIYGDVQVNFHLDPRDVQLLYQTVGANWFDTFVPGAVNQDFKEEAVRYNSVDIAPHRAKIAQHLLTHLQTDLGEHSIQVDNVFLRNVDYSNQFRQAIEQKQVAAQSAARAKLQADQLRNQAAGERDATILRAEGQAEANRKLSASLTPRVIQYLSIQKLNPNVRVILPSGSNLFNLGGLSK